MRNFTVSEKYCLKSIELDPTSIPQYARLIRLNQYYRNFSKAQTAINTAIVLNEDALPIYELQGLNYLLTGDKESAIETFNYCIGQTKSDILNYGYLSYTYSACDFHVESRRVEQELDKLTTLEFNGNYEHAKAIIYLGRNDLKSFFKFINKAIDKGLSNIFCEILNNPIYSGLRQDSRYLAILKRGNLDNYESVNESQKPSSIFTIRTSTKELLELDPQDISYIQGEGNYSNVFWYEKKLLVKTVLRVSLKQLEQQLGQYTYLLRCHKSFIINIDKNMKVIGNSKKSFIESSLFPIRIPISRRKRDKIIELTS